MEPPRQGSREPPPRVRSVTDDPQFDYVAVDSTGTESSVETVTVDIEEPQQYNVISAASSSSPVCGPGN